MSNEQWSHGFYKLTPAQRRQILGEQYHLNIADQELLEKNSSALEIGRAHV